MPMIFSRFMAHVHQLPDKIAVVFDSQLITYRQLSLYALRLSDILSQQGIKEGDSIVVELDNSLHFVVLLLCAAYMNLLLIPLCTKLPWQSFRQIIDSIDANFYISTAKKVKRYIEHAKEHALPIQNANCLAFGEGELLNAIYHLNNHTDAYFSIDKNVSKEHNSPFILTMTSGSTGTPKPILLSQQTKINRAILGAKDLYHLNNEDVIITASPMYHSLAQRLVLLPLMIGATAVILKHFSIEGWFDAVFKYKISFAIIVSSHLEKLLENIDDHKDCVGSIKAIVASSSPLSDTSKAKINQHFNCATYECYGASEVGIVTSLDTKLEANKLRSVGKALSYVDLKIVDENKKNLPAGCIGEIICKTKTAYQGYFSKKYYDRFIPEKDYFYTGDLGWLDPDGYLYLAGRIKDVIKISGMNVFSVDVENVIKKLDFVDEVAVIGIPNSQFGEVICAIITIKVGHVYSLKSLKSVCFEYLADFQQPHRIEVVTELPKSSVGKILKPLLREQYCNDK